MKNERQSLNYPMLERILRIHRKISSGCFPSTKQLAFDIETSESTISRDIDFLRDRFLAPIEYSAKERGFFYSKEYDLPMNETNPASIELLTTAKNLLQKFDGTPFFDEICSVIDMVTGGRTNPLSERIAITPSPKAVINYESWSKIVEAIKTNKKIEFLYRGRWNRTESKRKVHPYQLLIDDGICFLYGYSEERNGERMFSINQMKEIVIIEETFELPKDFEFSKKCSGGKFGAFASEKKYLFKIEFYDSARDIVRNTIWADDQKIEEDSENDKTTITFTSSQFLKVKEWMMSQGAWIRPLSPDLLVEEWKRDVLYMAKLAGVN